MKNSTDYNFPQMWGRMDADEKSEWFLRQRVWRQVNRQYDAGMWEQWSQERLHAGMDPMNAYDEVENRYRK